MCSTDSTLHLLLVTISNQWQRSPQLPSLFTSKWSEKTLKWTPREKSKSAANRTLPGSIPDSSSALPQTQTPSLAKSIPYRSLQSQFKARSQRCFLYLALTNSISWKSKLFEEYWCFFSDPPRKSVPILSEHHCFAAVLLHCGKSCWVSQSMTLLKWERTWTSRIWRPKDRWFCSDSCKLCRT